MARATYRKIRLYTSQMICAAYIYYSLHHTYVEKSCCSEDSLCHTKNTCFKNLRKLCMQRKRHFEDILRYSALYRGRFENMCTSLVISQEWLFQKMCRSPDLFQGENSKHVFPALLIPRKHIYSIEITYSQDISISHINCPVQSRSQEPVKVI